MESEKKSNTLVLIIVFVIIFLAGVVTGQLLGKKEELKDNTNVEEKELIEKEEPEKKETTYTTDTEKESSDDYEKRSYELGIPSDAQSGYYKDFSISLKGKESSLELSKRDDGDEVKVDGKKIDLGSIYSVHNIAIINSSVLAIDGFIMAGDSILTNYYNNNYELVTKVEVEDMTKIAYENNNYYECEVRTCDDQTKTTYSYKVNDDATITEKLEKTEKTMCSAQC